MPDRKINFCSKYAVNSGVARAFQGGRVAHPEGQNEDENYENLRKNKNNW